MKGRYHWNKRGIDDIRKAAEYFEQAIKEDDRFALGYVGLADSNEILVSNWGLEIEARHEKARAMVNKALEIDQNLSEAHATRGMVLMTDFNLQEAEEEFKKATEIKPSYASAHQWYFHLLLAQLRWDEALKHIERALELDPVSQIINLNHAKYYEAKRNHTKAAELHKKAIELDTNFAIAHMALAQSYGWLKMFDEMKREYEVVVRLVQESYPEVVKSMEAMIAYFEDDKERLRELLPEVEAQIEEVWSIPAVWLAAGYFYLGDMKKGFGLLERSYIKREFELFYIRTNEMFDSVRDDPRFRNFLERLGLDPHHYPTTGVSC